MNANPPALFFVAMVSKSSAHVPTPAGFRASRLKAEIGHRPSSSYRVKARPGFVEPAFTGAQGGSLVNMARTTADALVPSDVAGSVTRRRPEASRSLRNARAFNTVVSRIRIAPTYNGEAVRGSVPSRV